MSARESEYVNVREEEEQMVARVGGRGRGLVQAVLRIREERAGRIPQNYQRAQDNRMRLPRQEVGLCDQEVERGPGGLQALGRQHRIFDSAPGTVNTDEGQQTVHKERQERPRTRVWARARPSTPPPTPRFPYENHSPPVGCFMALHRYPHCEDIPDNIFSLPPYSFEEPDPHPIMKTNFPRLHPIP